MCIRDSTYRCSKIENVGVSMRDGNPSGEQLEPHGPHRGELSDGAIGDIPDTPQSF